MGEPDSSKDTERSFDGIEEATIDQEPPEGSAEEGGLVSGVEDETIVDVISEVADTYEENKDNERTHNRTVLRWEMMYNAGILAGLSGLILLLAILGNLDPLLGLTFIAGIATGFGTNSALTSLSQ